MGYVGLLAPIAFIFALSALAQIGSLKKEVESLKSELKKGDDRSGACRIWQTTV